MKIGRVMLMDDKLPSHINNYTMFHLYDNLSLAVKKRKMILLSFSELRGWDVIFH